MKRHKWGLTEFGIILLFLLVIFILIFIQAHPSHSAPSKELNSIPRIDISLNDVNLEDINSGSKDTRYPGNSLTLTTTNHKTSSFDNVEIKGRGNTTWYDRDKKPYQIKFSEKVDLLNLGASRKYLLLANAFDSTFIRNDIAFYIERVLSEPYALSGEFAELYIDGQYCGLYYLTPKVEIGSDRINLNHPSGIIVELDNLWSDNDSCYYTITKSCLVIKDLVDDNEKATAISDFLFNFNKLELAANRHDYKSIKELIDIDDFARYYLISEFTINPDAYLTSFFFYKNGPNDKIHVGPGWDFDLSLNNTIWKSYFSPYETKTTKSNAHSSPNYSKLIINLTEIPEFIKRVTEIYNQTMSGRKEDLLLYTKAQLEYIHPAATKDQQQFYYGDEPFEVAADKLLDWLSQRYDYFESYFSNTESHTLPLPI